MLRMGSGWLKRVLGEVSSGEDIVRFCLLWSEMRSHWRVSSQILS